MCGWDGISGFKPPKAESCGWPGCTEGTQRCRGNGVWDLIPVSPGSSAKGKGRRWFCWASAREERVWVPLRRHQGSRPAGSCPRWGPRGNSTAGCPRPGVMPEAPRTRTGRCPARGSVCRCRGSMALSRSVAVSRCRGRGSVAVSRERGRQRELCGDRAGQDQNRHRPRFALHLRVLGPTPSQPGM